MKSRPDRFARVLALLIATLRIGNWLCLGLFAAMLIGSLVAGARLEAHLAVKYAGRVDPRTVILFLQALLVVGGAAVIVVERLLRALAQVVASVLAGDPFHAANAGRLYRVGRMLLALQLLDLGLGGAALIAHRLHVAIIDWQPSLTGWMAVLVAFVLARVFGHATAMRDDLAGTV